MNKPRIAITAGDPAGIGPEIVAAAVRHPKVLAACEPVVVADTVAFALHRQPLPNVAMLPVPGLKRKLPLGKPSQEAGRSAIECLRLALGLVRARQVQALVTAPVSKESFHLADYGFPGHTEWLAHEYKISSVGMLMVAGPLRALLLTRHLPLADVADALDSTTIEEGASLAHQFVTNILERAKPKIVLCGLNPHAGDNGLIGKEELKVFRPALRTLRRRGIAIKGPVAADSVFRDMANGRYDLALAAYHDQGMIPLKLFASDQLVNITLGLPFIRTSPGHGTAYDIAGKNKANPLPMMEAILLAADYARRV